VPSEPSDREARGEPPRRPAEEPAAPGRAQPHTPAWPRILLQAVILTAAGALVAVVANTVRAHGLPWTARSFDYQISCEENLVAAQNRTFTVDDLRKVLGLKDVVVVDIRSAADFAAGHVAGARSLPVSSIMPTDPAKLAALKPFRFVVVYDAGAELGRAEEFAGELKNAGITDVRFLGVGFAGWRAAGGAVATGGTP
jgi:rhodanese-related sulfurtransferase